MKLRFSTWQAVSTKSQAGPDKVSLKVQLEKCLDAGRLRGYIHVKDYTVPGQSRTQWTSLYHAEKHIPQLHEMLEAASRHEFDVLIVYDLNRFRELMRQVFDALCDCNVQLLILSDPREPVAPHEYTEEKKGEVGLLVGLRDIISRSETAQIQKHYRDKMPKRVTEKGLHPGLGLPVYGYRKPPGRDTVLIQDPAQVSIIMMIKDWFFAGCSLTEIADRLNKQRIPSPRGKRWWYPQVRYILSNAFYAGVVSFGITRRVRIRREGTIKRYKSTPVTNTGKHQPIWDLATHKRILAELERRGQAHPGIKTRQMSRLLYCWCGCVLWAMIDQKKRQYWICSSRQAGHASIRDDDAVRKVTEKIVYTVTHLDELELPAPEDKRPQLRKELADLVTRRKRWMDSFEDGALPEDLLSERIAGLTDRIHKKEEELRQAEQSLTDRAATRAALQELSVSAETLPHYYAHGPKKEVNASLHRIVAKVHVKADKSIEVEWR